MGDLQNRGLERGRAVGVRRAVSEQLAPQASDRLALPGAVDLAGRAVLLDVADVVADQPLGHQLDERRSLAGARPPYRFADDVTNRVDAVAVGPDAGHSVP